MSWLPRRKILAPVDFSEHGVDAIQTALELVESPSDVTVMHVLMPTEFNSPGVLLGEINDETRIAAAGNHLDKFLKRHDIEGVHEVIQIGVPGLVVCDYASETQTDLIVMPSHGYHGVRRILLGSVAERVLRHAECPVLVLRRNNFD